jgi:TonB family protein
MRRITVIIGSAILLTSLNGVLVSKPRQEPAGSSAQAQSADGLKTVLEGIFAGMKAGNDTDAYFSNLEIPDHSAWFARIFGAESSRLEERYEQLLPQPVSAIKGHFDYAFKDGRTNVEVRVLQQPPNPNAKASLAIVNAMVQPTAIYNVMGTSPQQKYPLLIGDFVYVDGRFRYIDPRVFDVLSGMPPVRIKVGGQTQSAKIVHKVEPIYPAEAKAAHVKGAVVLHVIIGTDGKIQEITPMSGDPSLSSAAVEAVRQWQYQPTLLNGTAVEVDTTVTVNFVMN